MWVPPTADENDREDHGRDDLRQGSVSSLTIHRTALSTIPIGPGAEDDSDAGHYDRAALGPREMLLFARRPLSLTLSLFFFLFWL